MPNPLHDPGLDPEYTEDTGLGGRGLERVSHGPFLAIRNFLNLPISFPSTTNCCKPCVGGIIASNF